MAKLIIQSSNKNKPIIIDKIIYKSYLNNKPVIMLIDIPNIMVYPNNNINKDNIFRVSEKAVSIWR